MLNACVIGLGNRGYCLVRSVLLKHPDIKIITICDIYEDRIKRCADLVKESGSEPLGFTDYKEALNVKGLDIAFVFTGWDTHALISIYAMEKGIPVGSEVGSEYTLENCFNLVRTQEKTATPYMLMENCCYNKEELLASAIARKGILGEIVHCQGAYGHDIRDEVAYGHVNRHYRFDNYLNRNLDNYPTHDLGPIAKLLDINRGNRILTVSSFASKAAGLRDYIKRREDATEEMKNSVFKQGDIITTVLTCSNGETIVLKLDTTLPRSYDREFTIRGSVGSYCMTTNSVFLDGDTEYWDPREYIHKTMNNAKRYEDELLPDIWKNVTPEQLAAGHGGMDYFCYDAFIQAVKNHTEVPIDVYDSAVWQAVGVLSEKSIMLGGMPQEMPDFTNGQWYKRKRKDVVDL
jgi:predicted dehydrogenase